MISVGTSKKREIGNIKNNKSEMKNTVTEMKIHYRESTVEQIKQRIKSVIWKIRKQKTPNQNNKKKNELKNKNSLRSLWDNFKCTNIHIMGVPEGENQEQGIENQFEKNNDKKLP